MMRLHESSGLSPGMEIEIDNVRLEYPDGFRLEIPALRIMPGEQVALVGNNGAGKTTLIRLLLGFCAAVGEIRIGGMPINKNTTWRRRTSSFLGESSLISFLTPMEYWMFVGLAYGLNEAEIQSRLKALGDFAEEFAYGKRKLIREYSQGNRNRIGIAAALLAAPGLLLLDEPFAHLDPRSHAQLDTLLQRLHAVRGFTLVISSHNLQPLASLCTRVLVLQDGSIRRDSPISQDTLDHVRTFLTQGSRCL